MPLEAARESPHIKTEPEEPQPEGASQGAGARGEQGWVSLSQGSKDKALFLPGGGEERDGEGRGEGPLLGGSCGERWSLVQRRGGHELSCHGEACTCAHLPPTRLSRTASGPLTAQRLLTLFLGQVGVQFEAAVGVPGRRGEAAALSTSVLSQPSPPPRSLCCLVRGGPETGRWLRRSSPPGPR